MNWAIDALRRWTCFIACLVCLIGLTRAKILLQSCCKLHVLFLMIQLYTAGRKLTFDLDNILVAVLVVLHNLNPVTVGVQQECNIAHAAIRQPLLPVALEVLESLASSVQVVNRNAYNFCVRLKFLQQLIQMRNAHRCDQSLEAGRCHCGRKSSHPSRYRNSKSTPASLRGRLFGHLEGHPGCQGSRGSRG